MSQDDIETVRNDLRTAHRVVMRQFGDTPTDESVKNYPPLQAFNRIEARLHAAEEERDVARKTAAKAVKDVRRALAEREELIRTRAEADARCLTLQAELDELRASQTKD